MSNQTEEQRFCLDRTPGRTGYRINHINGTRIATCWNRRNAELLVAALNSYCTGLAAVQSTEICASKAEPAEDLLIAGGRSGQGAV